jgi:tetratricopeptide (TPR) repeat protein/O-antigen ligase
MNIQKMLANAVVLAGFAMVPFIPFIVLSNSTFFPFIVGKNFAFRIVVEVMFSAWLVLAILDPAYRPKKSHLFMTLAVFMGIITLAAIFGENPTKSFWSNFERMEGVVTYFHLAAYFLIASTVLTVRGLWRPYLNLHLVAGAIMAGHGVLQWAGMVEIVQDGNRVNGTLGNAAYLGSYALFNIFLAAFLMARGSFTTTGERVRVALYGLLVALHVFVLYHTATRGAMLGFLVGAGIATLLIAIFERERRVLRLSAIGILVALALFVGGFMAVRNATFVHESRVLSRFASISLDEQTTKSRFMIWGMAIEGFKEHPVLGWGMENFNYVFNKYYNPRMYSQEQWFDRAHNVFFDWLIAGGLPALLAYLALFGFALHTIWWRNKTLSVAEKSILAGLLGGYFFQNLFVFDNITSLMLFFAILAYVESLGREDVSPSKHTTSPQTIIGEFAPFILGGAIVLAVVLVYAINYKGFGQNTALLQAMGDQSSRGGIVRNIELFKKAVAYGSYGTSEAREQLAQIAVSGLDRTKPITKDQQDFLKLAADEMIIQAKLLPNDARYQIFAGSFLSRVGAIDEALPYLKRAVELSPTKQTILFELGNAYYMKKDLAESEKVFRTAYELEPAYIEAKKLYIQILIARKKYRELEVFFKEDITKTPKDIDTRLNLASLYLNLGKRTQAIAEVRKAIEVDPSFKEKGESFIRGIETGQGL